MPTVLIVDDEPKFAEPARRALVHAGCDVRIAHSPDEAREYLQRSLPDAIILDILFRPEPGVELKPMGCDFLRELKSRRRTKSIPVVMFTVFGEEKMEKRCRKAGAVDYIRKNAGGARIIAALEKAGVRLPQQKPSSGANMSALCRALRLLLPREATRHVPRVTFEW